MQQLVQRLRGHRAAPDHGLVAVNQETDGHHAYAMADHRLHRLAIQAFRLALHAHHHRHAGAVDIRIQQADRCAFGRQCQRQVGRRGALAHAALAGCDGHHVLHALDQLNAGLHRMRHHPGRDLHVHLIHAGQTARCLLQGLANRGMAAGRRITHLEGKGQAVTGPDQIFHGLVAGERSAGFVGDAGQGLKQFCGDGHGMLDFLGYTQ